MSPVAHLHQGVRVLQLRRLVVALERRLIVARQRDPVVVHLPQVVVRLWCGDPSSLGGFKLKPYYKLLYKPYTVPVNTLWDRSKPRGSLARQIVAEDRRLAVHSGAQV